MKLGLIIFHKNIERYPEAWVKKCIETIKLQSYPNFKVYEVDYGGTGKQIYEGSNYESIELRNHAEAHNYLLDKAFEECDYVFNNNVDDFYDLKRVERQLPYLKRGFDVVSSNFFHVNENDQIIIGMKMHVKDIKREAKKNNNIIAHPVCAYSKKFWSGCTKLRGEEIPRDDFELWKRSFGKFSFAISPEFLLYYRVHQGKVS